MQYFQLQLQYKGKNDKIPVTQFDDNVIVLDSRLGEKTNNSFK